MSSSPGSGRTPRPKDQGQNLRRVSAFTGSRGEGVMKTRLFRPLYCLIGLALAAGPALAESRMEKSFKLEAGGEFAINTDMGRVTITGASGSGVRILVTSRRDLDDLLRFDFQEGARRVSVVARKRHRLSGLFFDGGSNVRFEIEVPSQTQATVHT